MILSTGSNKSHTVLDASLALQVNGAHTWILGEAKVSVILMTKGYLKGATLTFQLYLS